MSAAALLLTNGKPMAENDATDARAPKSTPDENAELSEFVQQYLNTPFKPPSEEKKENPPAANTADAHLVPLTLDGADGAKKDEPPKDLKLGKTPEKAAEKAPEAAPVLPKNEKVSSPPKVETLDIPPLDFTPPQDDKIQRAKFTDFRSEPAKAETALNQADTYARVTEGSDVAHTEHGTYRRDEKGRVTEMTSTDGKDVKSFKYGDANNPDRVTSYTHNGQELRYLGPVTGAGGVPFKRDGYEVASYSGYTNGQFNGSNWSGIISPSRQGVLAIGSSSGEKPYETIDASGKKLSESEAKNRNESGIWPKRIESKHADGTVYDARFTGINLDSLIENREKNGVITRTEWKKTKDGYVSDSKPGEIRQNLEMNEKGTISYQDKDGFNHKEHKDGSSETSKNGITTHTDAYQRLTKMESTNGESRTFTYDKSDKQPSSYTDKRSGKEITWSKTGNPDEWTDGSKTEIRKDLNLQDGTLEYKLADGSLVKETKDFAKITHDDKERPDKVEFPSGSSRTFTYDGDKLQQIKDELATPGKSQIKTWTREENSDEFALEGSANKRTRTISDLPAANGDYTYKTQDGKSRQDTVRNLERVATGEISLSSDNLQEAKQDLLNAAKTRGLSEKRMNEYVDQIEKRISSGSISESQVSKSLDNLTQILDYSGKNPHFNQDHLNTLTETALHNIANPMEIDQGAHPTCNITTVEVYSASKHPDEYTRLAKEIALTGQWKTAAGDIVTPPANALKPGDDEKAYSLDKPNSEKRNLASQVVQMTLINGLYETGNMDRTKDGKVTESRKDWKYVMVPSQKVTSTEAMNGMQVTVTRTIGEDRLVDGRGQAVGKEDAGPSLTVDDNRTASQMMLGYKMPYINGPYKVENNPWVYDLPDEARLLKAKADGHLPMGVPTMGGVHVQTIHDIQKGKDGNLILLLDNQHGEQKDGWVTLPDLHKTIKERTELTPATDRFGKPAKQEPNRGAVRY